VGDRLLIVDDEPSFAEFVRKVAVSCGYGAAVAPGVDAIWREADELQPTHMALDLQMPGADGIEVMRQLAARRADIRLIIMSGAEGKIVEVARRLAAERGLTVAAALRKPFRAAELRQVLEKHRTNFGPLTREHIVEGVEQGQFFLEYQPAVDLRTGALSGVEALVRWNHPVRGLIRPAEFIPAAEQNGSIGSLTAFVARLALREVGDWAAAKGSRIAINVSAADLQSLGFADELAGMCAQAGLAPSLIVLEMTETVAMQDGIVGADVLARLRLKGFHLSLDDFGTGYSSLFRLQRLPFSELKIDRAFVRDCAASPESLAIIRTVVDLAHRLGLTCVAEGVEDEATLKSLAATGCDSAQGHYISRSIAADALDRWSARNIPYDLERVHGGQSPPSSSEPSIWARRFDGTDESRAHLADALTRTLNPLWDFGRNSLVGWRPRADCIEVLMMPYSSIVRHFAESRRLLRGRRLMGDGTFELARQVTGAEVRKIALPYAISDSVVGAAPPEVVERLLRRYGIMETMHRAVALFDIVGFSKLPPMLQVAQLNSLECSINNAHRILHECGVPIDLARSTTGDGFYIWNREKGEAADLRTYYLLLFALADNAAGRLSDSAGEVPLVRSCFSIGAHYSYHQVDGLDPRGHDYIVGEVTISLARISDKCLPGQVLIGGFQRPSDERSRSIGPIEFVSQAAKSLGELRQVRLHGFDVDDLRCYVTGRELSDGRVTFSRFLITDKHGGSHAAFNQKFNVTLRAADGGLKKVYVGRQGSELEEFQAERVEEALNIVLEPL
jgi:EAL domain-containing protein (putative c-di-GMP-specific phosphodiesterase class I)